MPAGLNGRGTKADRGQYETRANERRRRNASPSSPAARTGATRQRPRRCPNGNAELAHARCRKLSSRHATAVTTRGTGFKRKVNPSPSQAHVSQIPATTIRPFCGRTLRTARRSRLRSSCQRSRAAFCLLFERCVGPQQPENTANGPAHAHARDSLAAT